MSKLFSGRFTAIATASLFLALSSPVTADDWPAYLRDNSRAGVSTENLELPLSAQWTIQPPEAPEKAWPGPDDREIERKHLRSRMTFDDAFHVAVVEGKLYYGSSVDHQIRCLDLESGAEIWSFFTGGPVRLAPTVFQGKVYAGSDDGYAYCLNAADGSLIWKHHPGPKDEKILGRQQMVSRWPVRTGITIYEDAKNGPVAYFAAGIFPHENIFLYAVKAEDGSVIWMRDDISQESASRNDLTPQGYLLANEDILVVPSGRSLPAVFDRKTGKFMYKERHAWRSTAGGVVGGTQALLADGQIYSWGAHHILAMDQKNGDVGFGYFAGHQMAVAGDAAYAANGTEIARLDRQVYAVNSRERHKLAAEINKLGAAVRIAKGDDLEKHKADLKTKQNRLKEIAEVGYVWKTSSPHESRLVVAGNLLFAGGLDEVAAYQIESGKQVWKAAVDGEARGLAVANGRLIVSTTKGDVVCFGSGKGTGKTIQPGNQSLTSVNDDRAKRILEATGIRRGFCLVLGSGNGQLAADLAGQSDLEIYCVEPDAGKVEASRERLASAGLYGNRVSVHHGKLDSLPFPNYFANLVVSGTGEQPAGLEAEEIARCVKPLGGMVCFDASAESFLATLLPTDQAKIRKTESFALLERGALPGAGSWSHQYGEPGNTACSYDYRIKGGLSVLWYGDPGEGKMVNRHEGAVGPLAINGRLFAQGEDRIMAYDAYNGQFLWERENPESIRTGVFQNQNPGNLVASEKSLFFLEGPVCVELDAATGKEIAQHKLPDGVGDSHQWGYVSYQDGILFGTATVREMIEERMRRRGRATEDMTDGIFAVDTRTGKHLWHYKGKTIEHRTVAIGEGSVYFIDSSITPEQRLAILHQDKEKFQKLSPEEQKKAEADLKKQDVRLAVALDSLTGKTLWEKAVDVTDCSEIGIGGGKLSLMYRNNVLVLCGANANGHYWKQFMAGDFSKRRLVALSGNSGEKLWAKDGNYRHRPIIVDDEIFAEPWAYDLYTGVQKMRKDPLTGQESPWSLMRSGHHCGMMAASPNMLTFRSGFTGFYDLEQDAGTKHFAGHRTGCWINAIPANGLISIPESSAGCVCLFSIASTIVMEPREERQDWAIFSSTGAKTPVKEAAFNLGAPGDRRDGEGKIWLAYPRPRPDRVTSLDLALDFGEVFVEGGAFDSRNADNVTVGGTGEGVTAPSWVYASRANGLDTIRLPLLGDGDPPASYRVTLHFAVPEKAAAGRRVFDVSLQGKAAAEGVAVEAGAPEPVVKSISGVRVEKDLVIQLKVEGNESGLPILNGIEVVRE